MTDTRFGNHHPGFTEFCGKQQNFDVSRIAGKAIAGCAVDMLSGEGLVEQAKLEFAEQRKTNVMWEPHYV